jgi:hypothetical protein
MTVRLILLLLLVLSSAAVADNRIHPRCTETATNRQCWVEHAAPIVEHPDMVEPELPALPPPVNWWRAQVPPGLADYYCSVGVPRYC